MKRLFVTGAAGMVGSYVPDVFGEWDLVLTDVVDGFARVDVTDEDGVRGAIQRARPDVVLHLAAATDVDRCETEPEWARRTNAVATDIVARACADLGPTLVYVSTGSVFPGDKLEPYVENDEPGPVNVYARAKLAGERAVAARLSRYFIVRAGWMMGGGARDKKFVGMMTQFIAAGRTPLRAVADTSGTPTYARDLLGAIAALLTTGAYGVYHAGNEGACTRYDMALAIRDALGRPDIVVEPVASSAFPLPAPRPRSEAIQSLALQRLGLAPRPWRAALEEYVTRELAPRVAPAHQG
jgi:dTDP-4-dehydrorhamnose reductase